MRTLIIVVLLTVPACINAEGQTFDELFRQKKTQRKYLAQQIAALKVYLEYLKEGYRITKKGLAIVGDITDSNLSDHTKYFGSLPIVNESLGGESLRKTVRLYQESVEQNFNNLLKDKEVVETLTPSEISYVNAVRENLKTSFENASSWLTKLTTDGELQIRDDGRIVEISKAITNAKDAYVFSRSFVNSTLLLVRQRQNEESQIEVGGALHGVSQNADN